MQSPARGGMRFVRSAALAVLVLTVSVGAHLAGGGAAPPAVVLAAAAALVIPGALALTRARLRPAPVAALMGVGQLLLHGVFTVFAPHASPAPPATAEMGMPGMAMPGMAASGAGAWGIGMPVPGAATSALTLMGPMLACHVVATVVLALAFARGDHAVWCLAQLSAWLGTVLRAVPRPPALIAGTPRLAATAHTAPRVVRDVDASVPRRGPPVAA